MRKEIVLAYITINVFMCLAMTVLAFLILGFMMSFGTEFGKFVVELVR